jgi:hypothetical protein
VEQLANHLGLGHYGVLVRNIPFPDNTFLRLFAKLLRESQEADLLRLLVRPLCLARSSGLFR